MMNKVMIQDWAKALVDANPGNLVESKKYVKHIGQVYDLAERVVRNILARYPNIPLVVEEVALASGLHDIGRSLQKDQILHGPRGAKYTEQKGLEKGVSASLTDLYRIAQMFRSHGFAYEYWQDPECAYNRNEFEPLDACLLVPRTWQEAIVTYSDSASDNGDRIKVQDRMSELLHRYKNDAKYKNKTIVRAIIAGQNRILRLAERVEALEQGKLTEQDIARYGIL